MAGYKPPNSIGIPFKFTKTGYSKPTYNPTNLDFHPDYAVSTLKAAIQVMGIYQTTTYTYKKYCPTYVVGYSSYGVQIIKGPCVYGGIRDLGTFIEVKQKAQGFEDLNAFLKQLIAKEVPVDLAAFIKSYENLDLSADIHGFDKLDISADIAMHLPRDLKAYTHIFQRAIKNLPASLYGWQATDLKTFLRGLIKQDFPAFVYGIPPEDLPAYLKVWPEQYLYASIHGWGKLDLFAYIKGKPYSDLSGYIGAHPWVNLGVLLKGWAREVPIDLPAYIRAFQYRYLPAYVFSYEIKDLQGVIYPIPYVPLYGNIHGWQEAYLGAILNGEDYPYQIKAYINGVGGFKNLSAYAKAVIGLNKFRDLSSSLYSWDYKDLSAIIITDYHSPLSASIYPDGLYDLTASIFPKMIRLTTLLRIVTLNHSNLSAMINTSCIFSTHINLSAMVRSVFRAELGAYITPIYTPSHFDLGAKVGETLVANTLDKISLKITISSNKATAYDLIPVYFKLFSGKQDLSSNIACIPAHTDLSAIIYANYLKRYTFLHQKLREKVYRADEGTDNLKLFKVVEFSLRQAVKEYVYLSTANMAYATDFFDKWILQAKAYTPENRLLGTKRKLFRQTTVRDISKYKNIDEVVRALIEFVSWEASHDLSATINLIHKSMAVTLPAKIRMVHKTSTDMLLNAHIQGSPAKAAVVGYENNTIDILE